MLKIGDFSKLTRVSIRMLRHYDEIGLLKPIQIDRETGYRYYAADQLPRLNRVLALQDLGFSLRQISQLLEQDVTTEQLRSMVLQKRAELEDRVRSEKDRLARATARLYQIETGDSQYDVVVKDVSAQWVASVRDTISLHTDIGYLFERLFTHLDSSRFNGIRAVIWHDDSFVEGDIDAEALIYVPNTLVSADVKVYELSALRVAAVIHYGSYEHLPAAYDAIVRWMDVIGYQITGANRELYLHYNTPSRPDDESYVTEIQVPIASVLPE